MKASLIFALLAALVALVHGNCYGSHKYKCVKDPYAKRCLAVKVCEDTKKERCGYDHCDYGYVCASKKKKECKNFIALKEKCDKKKVCKEVKKPCGSEYCGYDEECVKDKICRLHFGYGRRLAHDGHYDHHKDYDDHYDEKYGDGYYESCNYCKGKEKLQCYDTYKCVKKDVCKDVVVKKCVKDVYRPGYDVVHGGYDFEYDNGYHDGDYCGDEECGHGYKCALVYYKKCSKPCGHTYCDDGYECAYDYGYDDCKAYAYLETICKDVYEPTCVYLNYFAREYYYPKKCKTVYKCDEHENVCGYEYCGYGHTCALTCDDDIDYRGKDYYDDYKKYDDGYGHDHHDHKKHDDYDDHDDYDGHDRHRRFKKKRGHRDDYD